MKTTILPIITIVMLALNSMAPKTQAATIIVNSTADSGPGSLRDALASASDGDTIDATSIFGIITLTNGELLVTNSVDIVGSEPNLLAIDGNHSGRVFHISSGAAVSMSNLTITNGFAAGDVSSSLGGGVYNDHSTLTISNCVVNGNMAALLGGGIAANGTFGTASTLVIDSALIGNSAAASAGGIYNDHALLTVTHCTLSNNTAISGGAIRNFAGDALGMNSGTATILIVDSTLQGNHADQQGGAIYNGGVVFGHYGGFATLLVTNSTLSGNSARNGGGIGNLSKSGTSIVQIARCILSSNSLFCCSSVGGGGGIENGDFLLDVVPGVAHVDVVDSTLIGNSAGGLPGGGIYNSNGELDVINSTLSSNRSGFGGSIFNRGTNGGTGTVQIVNSTLSGSRARNGATIGNLGDHGSANVQIFNSTLGENPTGSGGGIYSDSFLGSASVQIGNSILSALASDANISNGLATVTSLGYNLCTDNGGGSLTATGDQININPMLGPLQDNGGPTLTHALLPGSPAINAGDPSFVPPPDFDQRGPGFPRVFCNRIDIGAFESQTDMTPPSILCPSNIVANATSPAGVVISFAASATDNCSVASATCNPPTGSTFAIGTTTVTCQAIDTSGNTNTCTFTIRVKGAAEQISNLNALVQSMSIDKGVKNALVSKLQAALIAVNANDKPTACARMQDFIDLVNAQKGKKSTTAQATQLTGEATRIRAVLGC